jgi:hypothetical protein
MTIAELATSAREWADKVWVWAETPDLWELYRSGNDFFTGDLPPDSLNTPLEHGIGHLVIGGPPTVRGILSAG